MCFYGIFINIDYVCQSQMSMMENEKKKNCIASIKSYGVTTVVATLFLVFFSAYTSPLFPEYIDYDSGIFMMMGRAVLEGKRLYVDIFDHKGPILFWIEAVGMIINRYGLFLVQIFFLVINLVLCKRMCHLFWEDDGRKKWKIRIIQGVFLLLLAYPLANGNLCEEYSLPFVMMGLYFFASDLKSNIPRRDHSFGYGLFIGLLAFIRINNAVSIFAICMAWTIILLSKKRVKEWLINLTIVAGGVACVSIPILVYFGIDGSASEMLYATFGFNMKYSANTGMTLFWSNISNVGRMIILIIPLVLAAVVFVSKRSNLPSKFGWVMFFITIANVFSLLIGNGYNHYFMIAVPVEIIAAITVIGGQKTEKGRFLYALCSGTLLIYLFMAGRVVYRNIDDYYIDGWVIKQRQEVSKMLATIPESDKDKVLGFDVPAKYYLYGNILPCYKYGILQSNWSVSDPEVMDDYIEYLKNGDAIWMMVDAKINNDDVLNVIVDRYELVDESEYMYLYKMKKRG